MNEEKAMKKRWIQIRGRVIRKNGQDHLHLERLLTPIRGDLILNSIEEKYIRSLIYLSSGTIISKASWQPEMDSLIIEIEESV